MARAPRGAGAGVRFTEAIEALKKRLGISSAEWDQLYRGVTRDAETAAQAEVEAMIHDLMKAVLESIESGGTIDTFAEDYERILDEHGWTEGSDWHRRLIYRQTTQTSFSAGRWEQAQRLEAARPGSIYGRLITAGDNRVRDTHREMHGVIRPIGDEYWTTHWPPNGFNCRCHVQIVTPDGDPRLLVSPDRGFGGNPGLATAATAG